MPVVSNPKTSRYYTYVKPILGNKIIRSYATYIFSLVTTGILIYFAIRPTMTTISLLQKQIEEQQAVSDKLDQKAKAIEDGKRAYQAIPSEKKEKIILALPQDPAVTTLIRNLQDSLPLQASISAIQVQPLTLIDGTSGVSANPHPSMAEVDFTYNVNGTYSSLAEAVEALSTISRVMTIRDVVFSKPIDAGIILSVTGRVYYLK